ncbi:conserved hypothetical protein [uncultured Dysgonomonas sp.]|uniref:Uncharacterized protein n=1 Tax=uncultured Dysgonomonas sp. TaxID=206096 RepID=A0A212IXD3_9BACT|nr:hypothetical protein [uncultured Dysgonomonas sp.]SBV91846.1 conserved hypothetical protein [uncultured Dysgonomonas sp.]
MKYYVVVFFILCFLACRSNRNIDRTIQEGSKTETSKSIDRKDSSTVDTEYQESRTKVSNEVRFIRTAAYRPDGTIRSIQEEWRDSGSTELVDGRGRSSENTVTEIKSDSAAVTESKKDLKEKMQSSSDNRPVQGVEWFYIALGFSALVLVALAVSLIVKYRSKIFSFFRKLVFRI